MEHESVPVPGVGAGSNGIGDNIRCSCVVARSDNVRVPIVLGSLWDSIKNIMRMEEYVRNTICLFIRLFGWFQDCCCIVFQVLACDRIVSIVDGVMRVLCLFVCLSVTVRGAYWVSTLGNCV